MEKELLEKQKREQEERAREQMYKVQQQQLREMREREEYLRQQRFKVKHSPNLINYTTLLQQLRDEAHYFQCLPHPVVHLLEEACLL